MGENKKLAPMSSNHTSFGKGATVTYRLVNYVTGNFDDMVAPPGSLGIGKIMSL